MHNVKIKSNHIKESPKIMEKTQKKQTLNKRNVLIALLTLLIGVLMVIVVMRFTGTRYNPSPEVVNLIEESPDSLVVFRSALGAFDAVGGNGNEIILTTEVENYDAYAERAANYGRTMADVIDQVLEEGEDFFVARANELRHEMGVDYVRLTIVYRGNGREITRASFYSQ